MNEKCGARLIFALEREIHELDKARIEMERFSQGPGAFLERVSNVISLTQQIAGLGGQRMDPISRARAWARGEVVCL